MIFPAASPTSIPTDDNSSLIRLIFILGGSLVVLLIALVFVMIYLLRKFKRKY
jgi:flagellar biogenesis protein FliO